MPRLVADLGLVAFPQYSTGDILVERFGVGEPERYSLPAGATLESMRIRGGAAAMTDALEASLPSGTVRRGARVERISRDGPSGVRIGLANPDQFAQRTVTARRVILTAPPRVIARTISFDPPLPLNVRRLLSATPTWMAGHAKFLAVYERPFWREAGLSGAATSFVGPMTEVHDASLEHGLGALFGFIALSPAARRALGDSQLCANAIAQFGRLFGPEALRPTATFFKDWATDPDTATSDDVGPPAGHPVYRDLPLSEGPWLDSLTFAGTESDVEHGGYLEGAIASAERAVAGTMNRMGGTAH
jgi:monoamine oxidase